jgi:ABC-type Fe3+-citrate transport system substrate-binding protein
VKGIKKTGVVHRGESRSDAAGEKRLLIDERGKHEVKSAPSRVVVLGHF